MSQEDFNPPAIGMKGLIACGFGCSNIGLVEGQCRSKIISWIVQDRSSDILRIEIESTVSVSLVTRISPFHNADHTTGIIVSGCLELTTDVGVRRVRDLVPGQRIFNADGSYVLIGTCSAIASPVESVILPARPGQPEVTVGSETFLVCEHFLCAALFGHWRVALRAGDLAGPVQHIAAGQAQNQLFRIDAPTGSVIDLAGYRALARGYNYLSEVHGELAPSCDSNGQTCCILDAREAAQVCQSRIIYGNRGAQ